MELLRINKESISVKDDCFTTTINFVAYGKPDRRWLKAKEMFPEYPWEQRDRVEVTAEMLRPAGMSKVNADAHIAREAEKVSLHNAVKSNRADNVLAHNSVYRQAQDD